MDIKVNQTFQVNQTNETVRENAPADDGFKFTIMSRIGDENLSERLSLMLQGKKIAKHTDIRDMKKYRTLIKDFMNEVAGHSHKFSRENFLDRRGRHRVYGIIRQIDSALDELAQELMKEEKDNIAILGKVDEIRGMILDILT